MIRTPECHASYLYLSYLRVPILPKVEGTPGTSGSKVPSYPWVPVVTTRGFLTSRVTTRWVLVRTSDFPEVPLPAGKNPCLSLRMAQLTLPTNRIWRRPYNPNADGNPNGDGHLLPQLGDVGAVLPVPMVNGVNDDPFLAPAPVGPLTQHLRDMDAGMANNNQTVVTHLKIHSLCQSKCTYLSVDCICMQKPSPKFSSTQHKEKAAYSPYSNQKAIPLCGIDCIFGQELQGTS